MRQFIWLYGRGWMAIMSPFVRFGKEGLNPDGLVPPYVIVINHLSFFDFYCMALLPFSNIAAAVRSWPFKMVWYAPFMRLAGYLDVESMDWRRTLRKGAKTLANGGSVLFFPEGHRSRDGNLQRFFSGPFKLAVETGAKILPLCITGTDTLLPRNRWLMSPATIRLAALPPIDPKDFHGPFAHRKMRQFTKTVMDEKLDAMRRI
jgi:1-acyl-sn-glycerol-3-phosphate acyltransferase